MRIETELLSLIEMGIAERDLKAIKRVLKQHPHLFNFEIPHGWPVLHRCLDNTCADVELVKMYFASGGDINRRTNSGASLLFLSGSHARGKQVAALLRSLGAEMSPYERGVVTLASILGEREKLESMRGLIRARPEIVQERGDNGLTLLHHALANARHYEMAKLLLESGADPNAVSYSGTSPLGCCGFSTEKEQRRVFDLLLSKGAEYTLIERLEKLIHDEKEEEVVRVLEGEPRLANAWCTGSVGPLLHAAVWLGTSEKLILLKYLLRQKVDPNVPNELGETALHRVVHRGPCWHPGGDNAAYKVRKLATLDVVRLLLQHGANIEQRSQRGFTPLHEAAKDCEEEIVKLLVESGAAFNARTDDGRRPLDLVYGSNMLGCRALGHWLKTKGACSGKQK
jgi:ankyrin repeat protein